MRLQYSTPHAGLGFVSLACIIIHARRSALDLATERVVRITMSKAPRSALTVAGSDSGGGAGLQADLKTFSAHGVYGSSVVTSLTAQNTVGVQDVHIPPASFVARQITSVLGDMRMDAIKTGMLPTADIVRTVADSLRTAAPATPLVVDPVMVATSGDALAGGQEWMHAFKCDLLPLATLVTPNVPEARALTGSSLASERDVRDACRVIHGLGAKNVLIKGGHALTGDDRVEENVLAECAATDIMFDGVRFHAFSKPRLDSVNTHGTGCTLAAAVAANLALGASIPGAVRAAKSYVFEAIQAGFPAGKGAHGVLNHMHSIKPPH